MFDFSVEEMNLNITSSAWIKMQGLLHEFFTEIEWFGLVRYGENNTIELYDILNYPQTVTDISVRGDFDKHAEWLYSLPSDKFKHLRMHGHSHVRGSVIPSETDINFRKDMVNQLPNENLYLFMIFNKQGHIEAEIYYKKNDVIYCCKKININIVFEDSTLVSDFLEEAKQLVKIQGNDYEYLDDIFKEMEDVYNEFE